VKLVKDGSLARKSTVCVCACVCVCLRIFDSLLSLYSFAISLLMHCFFKHVYWEKTKQEILKYTFIIVVIVYKDMQKITPLSPPQRPASSSRRASRTCDRQTAWSSALPSSDRPLLSTPCLLFQYKVYT